MRIGRIEERIREVRITIIRDDHLAISAARVHIRIGILGKASVFGVIICLRVRQTLSSLLETTDFPLLPSSSSDYVVDFHNFLFGSRFSLMNVA
jgi:hypothetical protein